MQIYEFIHDTLGVCFWTAPAVILAVGMVIMGIVHGHNQKKRDKNFEEDLKKELEEISSNGGPESAAL